MHPEGAAMITNDEQLDQAMEQLGRMHRALAGLRKEILPVNARNFAPMAEGPVEELRRLEELIGDYTGRAAVGIKESDFSLSEEQVGNLREIDLDHQSFTLRDADQVREVRCTFEEDLPEAAKEGLDHRVRVAGVRRMEAGRSIAPTLRVIRLEILHEVASELFAGANNTEMGALDRRK